MAEWRTAHSHLLHRCDLLEQKVSDLKRDGVNGKRAGRQLDSVKNKLFKACDVANQAEKKVEKLAKKVKRLHQKKRRADVSDAAWIEDLEEESAMQERKVERLQRQVVCLEGEAAKREEDYNSLLQKTEDRVALLKNRAEADAEKMEVLRRAAEDPTPRIDFGEKGEEYSYHVYRFCAKLLNCKITCTSASRVVDVVLEELYPKRKLRIPTREAMERFRRIMLLAGRYKSLKVLRLCDSWHAGGDATTKGKSAASRKTQIMNTSGWGTKKQADGTVKTYKVVLDLAVLTDGKADTEFQSMVKSLEIDLGPRLIAKLSMLTCASVITDHANTAHLGAEKWVKEKQNRWKLVPAEEKAKMTPAATKLAETGNIRKCGQHLINVLSSNYLGTKQKPRFKDGHPDDMAMTHGKREFTVLSRLCGVDVLGRHREVAVGRSVAVALRGKPALPPSLGKAENAPPLYYSRAEEHALCRW